MMIGVAVFVLLIIIIAGIGTITWRRMSNARLEALLEEQAAAEEEKPRELSVEEQKAMYGAGSATLDQPTSISTTSQFGQYATGMSGASDPQATISEDAAMGDSDLEALMSTPEPITASNQSSPASELLAEFSDEESDVEDDSVEFSHDELEGISEEVWSPDEPESSDEEDMLPSLLLLNQSPKQTRFLMRKNFLCHQRQKAKNLLLRLNQKKNLSQNQMMNQKLQTMIPNHNQDLFSRIAASVSNALR